MHLSRVARQRSAGRSRARETWRILAVGDVHSPADFEMPVTPRRELDLVATLGDIPGNVIERILWWARGIPVVGVPGNHDQAEIPGIINIHGRIVQIGELRLGGFGGARRYRSGANQFADWQVARRMFLMGPADVFVSHAPPLCTSRDEGFVHRGFAAFDRYIERRQPRLWLHGHLPHGYRQTVGATRVHGVVGKRLITLRR
jgi:hypothetical protein